MGAAPVFITNIKNGPGQIVNATGSALVTLVTPGANGSRVKSLVATSDDTSARVVQLVVTIAAVDYIVGEVNVPIGAGTNGTEKAVSLLDTYNLPWLQTDGISFFMELAFGSVLKVRSKVTVTAGKTLQFFSEFGDI